MTDVDRKSKRKNIVVRCLRPYKGYGLLRERSYSKCVPATSVVNILASLKSGL